MEKKGVSRAEAERLLAQARGSLAVALGEKTLEERSVGRIAIGPISDPGRRAARRRIAVSGSKNSALPALAACLLTADPVTLDRIPQVRDIRTMVDLLRHTGAECPASRAAASRIEAREIAHPEAPYDLVKTMRASSLVLGPLVARCGRARVSLPGGCAIGARPINLHVSALERLGAELRQEHGYIEAEAPHGLARRRNPFRPHHRHRHRRPADGRRARRAAKP